MEHVFRNFSRRNTVTYSLQLYTVRRPLEEDLPGTIARIAKIGFTRVEPYNFVATADALAAAFASNGISAPSGHAPLLTTDQDEIFTAARKLGITTVIEPLIPAAQWQDPADIKKTAVKLNAAAKKGADYGVRVGYHNHAWELESKIYGTTALEYFASLLDPELVLEVDTYWAAVGGEDPAALLQRLGDRVKFIHVKDGPLTTDDLDQLPAGQGKIAIWNVLDAAKSLEVGVVEFDDYNGDIFAGIAASLAYLNNGKP